MKKKILLFVTVFSFFSLFSQEASIFGVDAQSFLRDANTIVRYNPLNMFDGKSDTVYAINEAEFNSDEPLIQIYFGNTIEIDEIKIKPGYFDDRYFMANYRIKSIVITLCNDSQVLVTQGFALTDRMAVQSLKFDKAYRVNSIQISITGFYSYERWNDIVISDISFVLNNVQYHNVYGILDNAYRSYLTEYTYDGKGNLVYRISGNPESSVWLTHYQYLYDSYGRLFSILSVDGEGTYGEQILYEYAESTDTYPIKLYRIDARKRDKLRQQIQEIEEPYTVNADGILLGYMDFEVRNIYCYENGQLRTVEQNSGISDYLTVFHYQDHNCVLEEGNSVTYVYVYENNVLKWAIPVCTHGNRPRLFGYEYQDGLLIKAEEYTLNSDYSGCL